MPSFLLDAIDHSHEGGAGCYTKWCQAKRDWLNKGEVGGSEYKKTWGNDLNALGFPLGFMTTGGNQMTMWYDGNHTPTILHSWHSI